MKAAVFHKIGDIRVDHVDDGVFEEKTTEARNNKTR